MTIWIVSQSYLPYYGGITEHVWHLAEHLARRGHRVHLLTGRPLSPGLPPSDPDPPGVQVTRIGRTVRLPSHGAQACVTFGCRWTRRLARLESPAVVHLQSPLEPFLPLWALERIDGVKIGTFHTGGESGHWGYRRFGPWLRRSASRLRERLAVSAEAARFVADHVPGRYRIVPNGVELSRFARPVSAGPPHGQGNPGRAAARILYVGRLDARKGLEVLLDAFQALSCGAAPSRRAHLILVGDGPQRPALERRAAALRLPVTFAGAVARERLPAFYRDADLFVAPSTGGESFGITLVEAMAAGLPIVGADLRGYRETAGASGAAVFYPPACPGQLREALASLLADGPRRRSMGAAGLHFARRYDWKVIAGEIEDIYRAALAEPPACAGPAHQAGGLRRAILRSPRSVRASSTS